MATSKLMRSVLMSTSHETAFPDQELNRSMASSARCKLRAPLTTPHGALVAQGPVRIGPMTGRSRYTFGRAAYDTGSGVRMLIVSAQGKTFSAQAFCDLRIATYSGLSFDSDALTVS